MDLIDRNILRILQEDASLSNAEIAEAVGLSTTPCWRRIQKLEQDGVILRRVALVDPQKLNLGVTVFVAVRTNQHSELWFTSFAEAVSEMPEVVEFYRMSGDIDYLLRVVVPDIEAYDRLYKRLDGIAIHRAACCVRTLRLGCQERTHAEGRSLRRP